MASFHAERAPHFYPIRGCSPFVKNVMPPKRRFAVATSMIWAIIKPFMVMLIGLFMLVMLYLLWVEGDMLKAYWQSELVYAASAEEINPAHEGRMVRVTGPLCTHEAVSVGNPGSYPGVIEIQSSSVNAHAEQLQLGAWQVQGLHGARSTPFTYFVINTPGVHWVEVNDTRLALLPSGVEVTLVGRQRGRQELDVQQLDLFTDCEAEEKKKQEEEAQLTKERKMQQALLSIRGKFSKNAILRGMNLEEGSTTRDRNSQIGGHKA